MLTPYWHHNCPLGHLITQIAYGTGQITITSNANLETCNLIYKQIRVKVVVFCIKLCPTIPPIYLACLTGNINTTKQLATKSIELCHGKTSLHSRQKLS